MSTDAVSELTCREFVELVTEYLEGALSDERRTALDAHIAECGGCTAYLHQMQQTITALQGLKVDEGLPRTREEALAAFRALRANGHE